MRPSERINRVIDNKVFDNGRSKNRIFENAAQYTLGPPNLTASLDDSLAFSGPSLQTRSALALARQRDSVHLEAVTVRWLTLLKILS